MRIALLLPILSLAIASCGLAPGQTPEEKAAGPFALQAAGPFLAGEEPVLEARTLKAGRVELTLYRATDPVALATAFDDLGHPTVESTPLRAALNRASADAEGGSTDGLHGKVAESARGLVRVWKRAQDLPEGKSRLELGAVTPGLHLLEARANDRIAYVPVVVGDLSLVVKRAGDEILVWATTARSGAPAAGAAVTLLSPDRKPHVGVVGADGVLRATIGDVEEVRVVAVSGESVAVADPTWLPPARRERLVYLTTDRALYRPGETVRYRGIARRVVGDRLVPFGRVEDVTLRTPGGKKALGGEAPGVVTERGTFSGEIEIPVDASLGTWRLVATVDGRRYGAEIAIRKFRRPEAEVLVRAAPSLLLQGDPVRFTIESSYYAGGALAGAKVSWSVQRVARPRPAWRSAEAETFLGATERAASAPVEVEKGKGKLDAEGRLTVEVESVKADDDTTYLLTALVRDESGLSMKGRGAARAVRSLVALDLRTDRESYEAGDDVVITARAVDHGGRPVASPVRLALSIPGGETITREATTDASGLARFIVPVGLPGEIAIRLTALDEREREATATKTVWVTERGLAPGYGGEGIALVPDRETYAPGDTAKVLVLLPKSLSHSHLLLTVEGERLHGHRVEMVPGAATVLPVRVESAHGPSFRVRTTAVRDGKVWSGTATILAPPVEKVLRIEVEPSAAEFRPGARGEVRLKVTDREGNPVVCELGVAGVDEALLALAPDLAPSIVRFFHGPRGVRVKTFTSAALTFFDATKRPERLEKLRLARNADAEDRPDGSAEGGAAFGDDSEPSAEEEMGDGGGDSGLGAGGGRGGGSHGGQYRGPAGEVPSSTRSPSEKKVGGKDRSEDPRATFAATAVFAPHVVTGPDGTAVVPVTFPDDLTRWRFAAAAIDPAGRVGEGAGRAVTTRPLRLTVAAPRFLVERDRVLVPVVARIPTRPGAVVEAYVKSGPRLETKGETSWELRLGENGRAAAALDVTALGRGEAVLTGRAMSGDLLDAVETRLPVVAHGVSRASVLSGRLDGDRPLTKRIRVPADAAPGSVRVRLTFEPSRLAAVWRALHTLVAYPHGCTEQTLHRFLPDLAAAAAIRELELTHPRSEELPAVVVAGVRRLLALQHEDGGWGWWKEDATDPAMTALVVSGLAEAKALGAEIPTIALKRGAEALTKLAGKQDLDYPTRALLLGALHATDAVPDGLADRLFDDPDRLRASPATLVRLLPVLRKLGRDAEVAALTRELLSRATRGDAGTFWGDPRAQRWQDDAVETTALVIAALAAEPAAKAVVDEATRWLLARRDGPAWQSTRDTAAAVRALLALARARPAKDGKASVRVRIDDGIVGQVNVSTAGYRGEPVVLELPPPLFEPGKQRRVTLERAGDIPVDVTASVEWISTREDLPAAAEGMTVTRTLRRLDAEKRAAFVVHVPRDTAGTRIGDLLVLDVEVATAQAGEFLEVEIPYPAGCEPVADVRGIEIEGGGPADIPGIHRELHDDAAWFFLRRIDGPLRLRVLLRVTHAGHFHVLPARAALMYFPHVHGASAEARLTVEVER